MDYVFSHAPQPQLPEQNPEGTITIYRGAGALSQAPEAALSWSTSPAFALWFANHSGNGLQLLCAEVVLEDIIAYFPGDKTEYEVIVRPGTIRNLREEDMIPATAETVRDLCHDVEEDFKAYSPRTGGMGMTDTQATIFLRDRDCTAKTPLFLGHPHKPIYGKGVCIKPRVPSKEVTPSKDEMPGDGKKKRRRKEKLTALLPLEEYDKIIVLFSGGKDSMAAFWYLVELGVPLDVMELWHHDIDGGHPTRTMDWPVTQAYNKAFSEVVGVKLRTSWRVNGFFGEVYRKGASYPIEYEDGDEIKTCPLTKNQRESERLRELILQGFDMEDELHKYGYRMKYPAKSGDLARRWCSAALKIDVASSMVRNMEELQRLGDVGYFPMKGSIGNGRYCSPQLKRMVGDAVVRNLDELQKLGPARQQFPAKGSPQVGRYCSGALKASVESGVLKDREPLDNNIKILIVSGERRGESPGRAGYNEMEVHTANAVIRGNRLVHHWRAVIDFSLNDVWEMCRRHNAVCHPCYSIGWSRCSCAACIFGLPKHWAGYRELFPQQYEEIRRDEILLNHTIDNKKDLDTYVGDAVSCVVRDDQKALRQTLEGVFTPDDIIAPIGWRLPVGAFGGSEGGPC